MNHNKLVMDAPNDPLPTSAEVTAVQGRAEVISDSRAAANATSVGPDEAEEPISASRASFFRRRGDTMLYTGLGLLVAVAWKITSLHKFSAGDDISYWIAVVGGVMMLVLFTYPLRKYVKFMRTMGKVKWWFWFHLFLGVAGPWLILVHSTFRIGSLNAGVALISMGIVVLSGVVGRFINVRIHRGLDGERTSLRELSAKAGLIEGSVRSQLHFAPAVEQRLLAFEERELRAKPGWGTYLRQTTLLPAQQVYTYLRCVMELQQPMRERAAKHSWTPAELSRRQRRARRMASRYLFSVVRVAQYTAYERVFALWHLAHLPFVYLLIISAFVHVFAVHAY